MLTMIDVSLVVTQFVFVVLVLVATVAVASELIVGEGGISYRCYRYATTADTANVMRMGMISLLGAGGPATPAAATVQIGFDGGSRLLFLLLLLLRLPYSLQHHIDETHVHHPL